MKAIAYSYLRFSTAEQATGDSRRRQISMAEKYAADHNLKLDAALSFRDLGISAYRGRNAKEGALRAFLDAVERHLVPRGSFLLIESLDRLSRERILSAQALFMQIIQAGVHIVTLCDQRRYSLESLNQNPLDLIISLVSMMRANEESEMKSRRIRAAFAIKRSQLGEKPWSSRCPGWLFLDRSTDTFRIVEERADVVRNLYREVLAGVSQDSIVRKMNADQVPLFGHGNQRGKIWQKSLVRHLLRSPTVIGTLVPFESEYVDGIKRMRPQPPVENYYPAIVARDDWDLIQERRAAWCEKYRVGVAKTGRANLLAGLSRCPFCSRPMALLGGTNPNWRYYICRKAHADAGCSDRWVRYPGIEDALTIDIEAVIASCPRPALTSEARTHMLGEIRQKLYSLRRRRASILSEYGQVRQSARTGLPARQAVDGEIAELLAERKRLRIDRPKWDDITLAERLDRLRHAAKAMPVDRHALHAQLLALFSGVVIDWEHESLVFQWKHGGQSSVRAAMKPVRTVRNARRATGRALGAAVEAGGSPQS